MNETGLRCPNCNKKLGERLTGEFEATCPNNRCHARLVFQNWRGEMVVRRVMLDKVAGLHPYS